MTNVLSLRCKECGRDYPQEPIYVCDFCFGPLEVNYDYDEIAKNISRESIQDGPLTIWRYDQLLPASRDSAVDIGAGMTPLLKGAVQQATIIIKAGVIDQDIDTIMFFNGLVNTFF